MPPRQTSEPHADGIPGKDQHSSFHIRPGAYVRMVGCHRTSFVFRASLIAVGLAINAQPAEAQFKRAFAAPAAPPAKEAAKTQDVPNQPAPKPSSVQPTTPAANPTLETLKLPAGAVLVVCERMQQALDLIPR